MLKISPADSTILTYLASLVETDGPDTPAEDQKRMLDKLSDDKTREIGRLLLKHLPDDQGSKEVVAIANALREGIRNSQRNAPQRAPE
jgi:hypothetical protein